MGQTRSLRRVLFAIGTARGYLHVAAASSVRGTPRANMATNKTPTCSPMLHAAIVRLQQLHMHSHACACICTHARADTQGGQESHVC